MMARLKDYLKNRAPAAVIMAGRMRNNLLLILLDVAAIFPLIADSLRPGNIVQLYRFKKQARAEKRLRSQRIEAFQPDQYEKIMVLKVNGSDIGLFAYLLFALNQLAYCEKRNYFPVVYFGKRSGPGRNAYYDPRYGGNTWDYYFEPVAGVTYDDLLTMAADSPCRLQQEKIIELSHDELEQLYFHNPDSIFPYPYGVFYAKSEHDVEWYKAQRAKAHVLIRKYIRIKKHLQDEIDAFYDQHMKGAFMVGAHVRGTDKATNVANPKAMRIVEPETYFSRIDRLSKEHPNCKIFVATDQEQYLDEFKARYRERVIHYSALRSKTKQNVFQMHDLNGYRKGKDVLIEAQLLARCQFFLKCTSTVGEAVLWFNPQLEYVDLNYAA